MTNPTVSTSTLLKLLPHEKFMKFLVDCVELQRLTIDQRLQIMEKFADIVGSALIDHRPNETRDAVLRHGLIAMERELYAIDKELLNEFKKRQGPEIN